MFTFDTVV